MIHNFEYDANKHFPVPTKLDIWGWRFLSVALLVQGYACVQNNSTDSFLFWVGIFILFGGLCGLSLALNKNKPLVKAGKQYLTIKDDTIYWKLGLFQSKKEVAFKDIRKIIFTDREYFITTSDKVELCLPIRNVHAEKRKEFEDIVRAWYKEKMEPYY